MSREINRYDINITGRIHIDKDKIYVADQNKIVEITNYATSQQFRRITPNLKRNYFDAQNYKIADNGKVYANTGGNIFAYDQTNKSWSILNIDNEIPQDYEISPTGNIVVYTPKHFFSFDADNNLIQKLEHDEYIDRHCLLYTSPSPRDS